jgi:hypothetical protein
MTKQDVSEEMVEEADESLIRPLFGASDSVDVQAAVRNGFTSGTPGKENAKASSQ